MREQDQIIKTSERLPPVEQWRYVSPGSVYACDAIDQDNYLVGGSTWDRRHTPFNEVTRNAPGVLSFLTHQEGGLRETKQLLFPSMVNAIIPLEENVFVGCKGQTGAFNVVSSNLEHIVTCDDGMGGGVYNAIFHKISDSIIVATRRGWLLSVDPYDLTVRHGISLNDDGSRLWSLAADDNGTIVAGDYHGRMYVISNDFLDTQVIHLPALLEKSFSKEQQRYDPSVFGITTVGNKYIVASIRWGQLYWFEYSSDGVRLVHSLTLTEEISQIAAVPRSEDVLIGTRNGMLLRTDYDESAGVRQIIAIPPSYQSDNAIWSIVFTRFGEQLVSFADGQVVSFSLSD